MRKHELAETDDNRMVYRLKDGQIVDWTEAATQRATDIADGVEEAVREVQGELSVMLENLTEIEERSSSLVDDAEDAVEDAEDQAELATEAKEAAQASEALAKDWAVKMDGKVVEDEEEIDYSAKYYAQSVHDDTQTATQAAETATSAAGRAEQAASDAQHYTTGHAVFVGINSTGTSDPNYYGGGATGTDSIAVGKSASAGDSGGIAIGAESNAYRYNSVAIGYGANSLSEYSVAIGDGASCQANTDNSVAIGCSSVATSSNEFSIGCSASGNDPALNRVITHVADGTNDTDAATVRQMNTKQATLTFDSSPTQNSTNPVTSGGVYTALADKFDISSGSVVTHNATSVLDLSWDDGVGGTDYADVDNVQGTLTVIGGHLCILHFTCTSANGSSGLGYETIDNTKIYYVSVARLKNNYLPSTFPIQFSCRVSFNGNNFDYHPFTTAFMGITTPSRTDQTEGMIRVKGLFLS